MYHGLNIENRCKGLPFLHMKAGGSVCPPSYFTVDNKMHYLYQEVELYLNMQFLICRMLLLK